MFLMKRRSSKGRVAYLGIRTAIVCAVLIWASGPSELLVVAKHFVTMVTSTIELVSTAPAVNDPKHPIPKLQEAGK